MVQNLYIVGVAGPGGFDGHDPDGVGVHELKIPVDLVELVVGRLVVQQLEVRDVVVAWVPVDVVDDLVGLEEPPEVLFHYVAVLRDARGVLLSLVVSQGIAVQVDIAVAVDLFVYFPVLVPLAGAFGVHAGPAIAEELAAGVRYEVARLPALCASLGAVAYDLATY